MSPGDLRPSERDTSAPTSTEVQFALVIARILDTIKADPEYLRQVVYDLARHKLQEQFTHADAANVREMQRALEAAIYGVEAFSRQHAGKSVLGPSQPSELREYPVPESIPLPGSNDVVIHSWTADIRYPVWSVTKRAAIVSVAIFTGVLVFHEREQLANLLSSQKHSNSSTLAKASPSVTVAIPATTPIPAVAPKPDAIAPITESKSTRVLPTEYGVYAVDEDRPIVKLHLLPGKAPDIRIAFSPTFKVPDQAPISSGHVKFVVFRREAVNSIPENAEIRVVARISREFSSAAAGKKLNDDEDVWVIRNVSYPLQVSPIPGSAEMYELHSEDPMLDLQAGNYVLVLKAQTYYFRVGGEIVDPRQCIERVVAANGIFYSPCRPAFKTAK